MADETAAVATTETVTPAAEAPRPETREARVAAFLAAQGEPAAETPAEGEPAEGEAEPAAAKPVEPAGEAKPVEADKDAAARRREFAALTRRQREIRDAERGMGDVKAKADRFDRTAAKAKEDAVAALAELLGIDEEAAVSMVLDRAINGGTKKPETADERVAKLEKQIADDKADNARKQREAEQVRAVEGTRAIVRQTIEAEPDRFDLLIAHDAFDDVYGEMAKYYSKHRDEIETKGIRLDVRQFADAAEKQLEAALSRSKKFGRGATTNNQAPTVGKKPAVPPAPARTLTNNNLTTGPALGRDGGPLELEARKKWARQQMGIS
jgi:hypothetical protein